MNKVALSDDLNVITAEINSYKQVAGQAIFEIGKRLKHVKENDLVHGEWTNYCEKTLDMTIGYANRYIRVFEEFGDSNMYTSIGLNKLYQIATLPEGERDKEHQVNGEKKTVEQMTSRELESLKRQLNAEKKERERLERENQKLSNQEPKVIEKVVEVVPDEFKQEVESAKRLMNFTSKENERLQQELDAFKMRDVSEFDQEAAEWELKKLQHEADRNTAQIRLALKQLNNKVAVSKYMYDAISASSDYEKQEMRNEINILKDIIAGIEASLNNRREIN